MTLGPIEVITIGFTEKLSGEVLPELTKLVEADIVSIIDGVFARKDENGDITIVELEEATDDEDASALAELADRFEGLISDEDVDALTAGLEPGTSAAILVFEHTWVKGFRDAVWASGGSFSEGLRIPGPVVEEILATVPTND